jgi:hypothetical protein
VWFNVRNAAFTKFQRGSVDLVMGLSLPREEPVSGGPGVAILALL